ncbi:Serine protease, subtilisin family [Roseateles sp. YR242]|uniref:S8 family serine peptidase n=1 Tax=Roseateles sp. YR242 TaxID=1855305 RepID=UPI0008C09AFF|nr:S8 family serine peptidase [Roseateles sp. YR242]SEK22899.1 Serine protease, subtilisin family [Roseateles sp. YR242]
MFALVPLAHLAPLLLASTLAPTTLVPTPGALSAGMPSCAPAQPRQLRYLGRTEVGLKRYTDLSPAVRDELALKVAREQADDTITMGRDGLKGRYRYEDDIRHALLGRYQLCDRLDLSAWAATQQVTARVYCSGDVCLAVTTEGRMVARIKRRKPDAIDALAQALQGRQGGPQEELTLPPPAAGTAAVWARGRVLVLARPGLSDRQLEKILAAHGGRARRLGLTPLHVVSLPDNASETAVAQLLARHPQLKSAELDMRISPAAVPNDPYLGSEWHLSRIQAPTAWDTAQGASIRIAILDTGIDATHPDLAARMVPGWNFYDGNSDTSDVNGHGTAVAGAAAATMNNGVGVAAVAGQAGLMPVRIADPNAYAYWSTTAQGLIWAADQGARVANISYNGVAASSSVQSAADYLRSKGGLVVVAAGNNGIDEGILPSPSMIPVSATDESDNKTSWSSYGAFVALAAPGQNIWTTTRGGGYGAWWGTSLASPVVAGAVALMMSARPSMSNSQVESLLYASAVDLGSAGRDATYGWGRLDVAAAVRAVVAAPAPDSQAPVAAITAPLPGATVNGLVAVDVNASDNIGVVRVDLKVNGTLVASDTSSPYGFSWDSTSQGNGVAQLSVTAVDAAGNAAASTSVQVSVVNAVAVDSQAPQLSITSPVTGSKVSANVINVTTSASDNAGASGIRQQLYIDGQLVATVAGATLSYSWNVKKAGSGSHVLQVVAQDAAGNVSVATSKITK